MKHAIQWTKSLLFSALIYLAMLVLGLAYLPWAIVSAKGARAACHAWCRVVLWLLPRLTGLTWEVRGTPPTDEVLIAAKHQSFLDIILIYSSIPSGKFIMKRELMWAPILGLYALRIGCVPVNRGKRAQAIQKMVADVSAGRAEPGQLIIYPQGTRVAPGVGMKYKVGSAVLYEELAQDCVPVACNVGVFWPRRGILRKPGHAVVEFLERIPAGLEQREFLRRLEDEVETTSNRLMREAGFQLLEAERAEREAGE